MNPVFVVLVWAGAIAGAFALKTYVRRFAGWNLLLLIGATFVVECFGLVAIATIAK